MYNNLQFQWITFNVANHLQILPEVVTYVPKLSRKFVKIITAVNILTNCSLY